MGGPILEKNRILVVDDDVRSTSIFVRMLREDGHEVEVAHDGTTAIEQINRSIMPDILVTDIQMPHLDGFAVARYARELHPLMPIFFVTGYPERIARRVKELDPPPKIFVKPLDYLALVKDLAGVLRNAGAPRSGK